MSKKTAFIILLIVAILAAFFTLYQLFFVSSTNSGNPNDIKNKLRSFFPNTTEETNNDLVENQNNTPDGQIIDEKNIPKLRQVSSTPTSGAVIITRIATTTETIDGIEKVSTTSETVFRYAERSTGHIYENVSTRLVSERISNTTVPKNFLSVFSSNGKNLIFSTLDDVRKNFVATLNEKKQEATVGEVAGYFLPNNTENISVYQNKIAYTNKTIDLKYSEVFNLFVSDFSNATPSLIFSSPVTEWLVDWVDSNTLSLNSKPSYAAPGYLYEIKTNGSKVKIFDEIFGLNTKSNSEYIITTRSTRNYIDSFIYNKSDKTFKNLYAPTFPREKCVFSTKDVSTAYCASPINMEQANYPDDWYLGKISNQDVIHKINLEESTTQPIELQEFTENYFDVQKIYISPNEDFLLFINKKDLTLWSLEIN